MAGDGGGAAPLFTILLPTHSRPDVIGYAIGSILAQTQQDFELFVVGDGAAPGTAAAVQGFSDPRIRWFDLPKAAGFGYANRNIALRHAQGRYVALMSDDDLLFSDHLNLLRAGLDGGAMIACTRAAWVSSDGIAAPFPTNLSLPDEAKHFLTRSNCLPAACFAYVREALDDPAPWPEDSPGAGDWDLWRRIIAAWPDRPLAVDPTYSVLHFAARRRGLRHSGMPDLSALLHIADHSIWWPETLKIAPDHTLPEQATYWDRISDPDRARHLRNALSRVTDRLAWEMVQSHMPAASRRLNTSALPTSPAKHLPSDFDSATYLEINPDVAAAGMEAGDHWLRHGQIEGRNYKR